ncbi:unnamed protein product [Strongylus vulgaris]|uniref:Uncharacterized protein n=1 Tax=Strongylus vulgaris TaxID=40348 RepID=A0A3P7M3C9_STRVU|nr:unnamed protein product [Strongylus vulgaris]
MDGKRINIKVIQAYDSTASGEQFDFKKPPHSGSNYWNYQNYYSIILLAICDIDYPVMAFDVGAPGRAGNVAVYRSSTIKV